MKKLPTLSLPNAIVIAGVIIALSVAFTSNPAPAAITPPSDNPPTTEQEIENLAAVAPITAKDHIYGNPDAPITIVEYSDLDCPFCERFHSTLQQIVAEYPNDVRWVYRHFPLEFHPHADDEAVIAECVNKLGGNDKFWDIIPHLLAVQSSQNEKFDTAPIFTETSKLGINTTELQSCYDTNEFQTIIDADLANGAATGGNGTPWSIIIKPDGTYASISGAQPYTIVKSLIDDIVKNQ